MALKWKLLPSPGAAKDGREDADAVRRAGFTVRIARVFSKSNNGSKQEVVQTAPFLNLPYELLEKIFDAVESKNDLCRLRVACVVLNEYLLPRVFEELIIDSAARGSHNTGHLLRALASGKSPCCQLTTTLRLRNLLIFSSPSQSHWQNPNVDETLQPLKEHYILPALKGLRNLKRVYWDLKVNDPYTIMAEGLAAIPSLKELHITFNHWSSNSTFPFDKFSGLHTLGVEEPDVTRRHPCGTVANIRKAIASSPELSNLRIRLPTLGETLTLDEVIVPPVSARLTHLRTWDNTCASFNMCLDALSTLTSIEIPNNSEPYTSPLWATLTRNRVQLLSVTVQALTRGLLTYLESYSGLRAMHVRFGVASSPVDARSLLSRFFTGVLPKHRLSLCTLCLDLDPPRDCFRGIHPFSLETEDLKEVVQCPLLSTLSVVVQRPGGAALSTSESVVTVGELFAMVGADLPRLRHLRATPAWPLSDAAINLQVQRGRAKETMVKDIQAVEVPALDTFGFSVQVWDTLLDVTRKDLDGKRNYLFTVVPSTPGDSSAVHTL